MSATGRENTIVPQGSREAYDRRMQRAPRVARAFLSASTAIVRFAIALIMAQSVVGAIVLLGYVYRRMQNHAIAVWTGERFQAPKWLFALESDGGFFHRHTASLWLHLRTGVAASLSLAVLTLPSAVTIALSWYTGWNNSFYKGYEYALVGPLLGVLGIGLGMLLMTYLPYAQARHATTGEWRLLFSWRQNLQLISMHPFANLALPIIYFATGLLVAGARGLLTFAPQWRALQGAVEADPGQFLTNWYFYWSVPFILLLFVAKRVGARLYASAIIKGLQNRRIAHGELHDAERYYIRGALAIADTTKPSGGFATLIRALWPVLLWLPLFAALYIQQFIHFIGAWGWLNHPIVWLPVLF
jgi:hypothetical protein